MTDRVPLPTAAWYIASAASRLTDVPVAVTIHGGPIVLFRDNEGAAHALHDRCPHRGVMLSLGSVEDGRIVCAYHGWRFDGTGACRHIPSLSPDQPVRPAGARAYPVVEQDSYVWVWTGDAAPDGGPLPIPDVAGFAWFQGAIDLACEPILPIENNLDICHAAFTHPGLHPQWFRVQAAGFTHNSFEVGSDAGGVTVRGPGTVLRFDLPDRVTVGSGDAFRLVLHHVPTLPGRCRQHWLFQRERVAEPVPPLWSDNEPEILAQDRRVLESAQANYAVEGDGFEHSVAADAPTLAARRVLALAASGAAIAPRRQSVTILN